MTTVEEVAVRPRAPAWLLRAVNQRYGSTVAAALDDAGLGGLPRPGYWLVMAMAAGASDASALVGAMGVSKQAVSKVLDALVSQGFVERRPHPGDRRRTDLVLTAKGEETVEVIRLALRETEERFVDEVGSEAWRTTVETLAVLAGRRT